EHSQLLKLIQFPMGLDDTYGPVKCLILTVEPLPDVKYAFATFFRDESHRQSHVNASTSRHTIDRCYELLGYPPGFKKKGTNRSVNNVNNVVPDKADHSRGEVPTILKSIVGLKNVSNIDHCEVCHSEKQRIEPFPLRMESYYIQCIKDGPFKPKMTEGVYKPEGQWTSDESRMGEQKVQKDYKAEYKLALLKACPPTSQSSKPFQSKNKDLVAETFNWDEEELYDDEEETRVQVL
nr:hypothetical protein [Tanacetum cinerariifolium]